MSTLLQPLILCMWDYSHHINYSSVRLVSIIPVYQHSDQSILKVFFCVGKGNG